MSSQRNRARGCYKRTITLIENFVNSLTPDSIIDVNELIIRESLLVKTFDDYDTVQKEIEVSIDENDDDQISLQFEDRQAIVNRYVSLHSKIKTLIQKHYMDSTNNGTHAHHSGILGMNSQPSPPAVKVKLPNLNIPTFDGNYGEWRTFIDLFTASVHNDNLLAKSQKFVYLKSFLKGEPLSLIRELNISDDNYSKALDLLKTQYDKKMPAINYHIVGLLEATLIKGLNGLRDFNSLIRQHINALEALGIKVIGSWDLLLIHIFCSKLDRNLRNDFELERDQKDLPTLNGFFNFLNKRITAWESSAQINEMKRGSEQKSKYFNKQTSIIHSHMVTSTDSRVVWTKCIYCKALGHKIYKCTKFNSEPTSTRRLISKERLCFNCFGKHWFLNVQGIGVGFVQENIILFYMKTRLHIFHKNKGSMKKDLISISLILKCKDLLTLKLKDHISKGLFSLNILLLHKNLLKFKH
ncbi:hypothetical protein JTB14_020300 [Gonioctena quinquepunctata]|nr:hypothetical protein JTB14_020300 [Gonioctena quinquepunctata]